MVYDPDKTQGSLSLLKADDNISLFLDKERNPMMGNGDFSYTLNRANPEIQIFGVGEHLICNGMSCPAGGIKL